MHRVIPVFVLSRKIQKVQAVESILPNDSRASSIAPKAGRLSESGSGSGSESRSMQSSSKSKERFLLPTYIQ